MKTDTLSLFADTLLVVGPTFGFLSQIIKRKVVFSPLVSFIAIATNIVKIYYWQMKRFSFCIVLQAVLLIFLHNLLIAMYEDELSFYESKFFRTFFTNKTYKKKGLFVAHLQMVVALCLGIHVMHYVVSRDVILFFCEFVNPIIECGCGVLQFVLTKYDTGSDVSGKKKKRQPRELFLFWVIGDILKVGRLIMTHEPKPIIAPAVLQLLVNCFLFSRNE